MKIVYRPLSELKKENKTNKSPAQRGQFENMLKKHLNEARTETKPDNQKMMSQLKQGEQKTLEYTDNIENLKDLDSEYYQKGVKKKTLAATFSARNNSKLENRIKKFEHLIEAKAKKYNISPKLLAGLIRQESNFNPYAVSHCGAMGLGQLMPETARYLGVVDPFNAAQNIDGAAKYLKEQLNTFGGNIDKALAAYNAGPGAVKRHGGIPPYKETQNYVRSIKSHVQQIAQLDVFADKKKA